MLFGSQPVGLALPASDLDIVILDAIPGLESMCVLLLLLLLLLYYYYYYYYYYIIIILLYYYYIIIINNCAVLPVSCGMLDRLRRALLSRCCHMCAQLAPSDVPFCISVHVFLCMLVRLRRARSSWRGRTAQRLALNGEGPAACNQVVLDLSLQACSCQCVHQQAAALLTAIKALHLQARQWLPAACGQTQSDQRAACYQQRA